MKASFLALTIGPVYKTIKQARSTRELWAASYLFSALMREILTASKGKLGVLLSPQLNENKHRYGAGIYPDRAFWKLDNEEQVAALAEALDIAYNKSSLFTGLGTAAQFEYFRIYAVQINAIEQNGQSVIVELNKMLDDWELQDKISNEKPDVINTLGNNIQKLYNDGHNQGRSNRDVFIWYDFMGQEIKRLPSIIELASSDLKRIDRGNYKTIVTDTISAHVCRMMRLGKKGIEIVKAEFEEQETIIRTLKNRFTNDFKFRHKYAAFIKADGDNMGEILKEIGNDWHKTTRFSKLLAEFTVKAVDIIIKYGGIPIYAGGDDLLFIAPIQAADIETADATGDNLFELIDKIDRTFPSEQLAALADKKAAKPSLSFGISVSYYKFPMAETLDVSDSALGRSKKMAGKNAVSFEVRKHSGMQFGATLQKCLSFKMFYELLKQNKDFGDVAFLTSVMHKITELELLYKDAIETNSLASFFKHHFNEKDHGTKFNSYLKSVRLLTETLFDERGDAAEITGVTFAALRFVQFINQPDHE